ncbi:9907_t:CDS:2, partial [Racocetra fulgida]
VQNGGLPSPGQMKITFKEGESESYVLIEHTEPLPTYTPREDSTSTATQALGTGASSITPPTGPLTNATSPSHSTSVNSTAPPPIAPDELPPSDNEAHKNPGNEVPAPS